MSDEQLKNAKKDILWRVYLLFLAVFIFAVALIARMVYIQFSEGPALREKAKTQELREFTIKASRGNILAGDGSLLATSIPIFEIRMDVANGNISDDLFNTKVDSLAYRLSLLFGNKSKTAYKRELIAARKKGERYFLIHRKVTYEELKALRTFPILRRGKNRGGLITIQQTRRERPFGELASRTIGYVSGNNKILVGLEGAYTNVLTGKNGKQIMRRINHGAWIPIHDANEIEPADGLDIVTSLNINIQDVAENALLRQMIHHKAKMGCAILMEVKTGHIEAIANLKYDPKDGYYKENYNMAIAEKFEPGSTFKLPNIIAALEVGNARLTDSVITGEGFAVIHGLQVQDVHKIGNGRITVKDVFEHSSNVGMAKVINKSFEDNPSRYVDFLYSMSLNKPLGIEIKGERKPFIKHPVSDKKSWWKTSLTAMSFGYEVEITPLQLLTFYNAVANDGKMVKPVFVTEVREGGKTIQQFDTKVINPQIASTKTIQLARQLMEGVVLEGTAKKMQNDYFTTAGKTGTAKISGSHGYEKGAYNSTFIGYFPADNPQYSCVVVIQRPTENGYYGGTVAGPVFKEIAAKVFSTTLAFKMGFPDTATVKLPRTGQLTNYTDLNTIVNSLGIKNHDYLQDEQWASLEIEKNTVTIKAVDYSEKYVPDLRGMKAKDAVYLSESLGLKASVNGKGFVRNQSLKPGIPLQKGKTIKLQLAMW
ncbi:MAG: transpeptidase family protein [Bacteroidales bacterium]|nr:transpeptidase family protein [Bacteroidales bacterium]